MQLPTHLKPQVTYRNPIYDAGVGGSTSTTTSRVSTVTTSRLQTSGVLSSSSSSGGSSTSTASVTTGIENSMMNKSKEFTTESKLQSSSDGDQVTRLTIYIAVGSLVGGLIILGIVVAIFVAARRKKNDEVPIPNAIPMKK